MQAYEIIEEIRKDCPVNPITELKTLSSWIERLREFYLEARNGARCWYLIDLIDNLLLCTVNLGHFVPCDANGVPLEKPVNHEKWLEYQEHGFELLFGNEAENQAYNEAQKNVIFEGWEVHSEGETVNKNGDRLSFFGSRVFYDVRMGDQEYQGKRLKDNSTLADLAEATTRKLLKIK